MNNTSTDGPVISAALVQPEAAKPEKFGLKHALALAFALGIVVAIVIFREQICDLQELGYLGAFLVMLLGNATLILPAPGLAFIILLGATLPSPLLVGLAAGVGSTIGELTGYIAGFSGSGIVKNAQMYQRVERQVKRYGLWIIMLLALIPNPTFDIVGLVAGAMGIKWWQFLLATGIGKTIKAVAFAYAGALGLMAISGQVC